MKHFAIIWSWGREHAIATKILGEGNQVTVFPGNPWMLIDGCTVESLPNTFEQLAKTIKEKSIDIVIVWPEAPLCEGIVDALEKEWITTLWPNKATALLLEGDKDGAKVFMRENDIPTSQWKTITQYDDGIWLYLETLPYPVVVKANGLAAGKGVKVCKTQGEAIGHIKDCFAKKFDTGEKVVIEEFVPGREVSAFAFIDTESGTVKIFTTATDHKAEFDGGKGDNTGGMGTFSPAITSETLSKKVQQMFENVVAGLKRRGLKYTGPLFAGLMVTPNEMDFNVLEYNVRFWDPETQSMLERMDSSLAKLMWKNAQGKLNEVEEIEFSTKKAVTLVLSDPGYPRSGSHKGKIITGLESISTDVSVYHMGTKKDDAGNIVVNGGRVLSLTALGETYTEAQEKVYTAASRILFGGDTPKFRTDIGDYAVEVENNN